MTRTPPPDRPKISDSELVLLKELWSLERATVRALHRALVAAGSDWAYTTVQTMLARLEEKGCVRVDRSGFAHVFTAAVSRTWLVGQRLDELRDKLCDGAAGPLLLHLAKGQTFTAEEIARFRQLLRDAEPRPTPGGEA